MFRVRVRDGLVRVGLDRLTPREAVRKASALALEAIRVREVASMNGERKALVDPSRVGLSYGRIWCDQALGLAWQIFHAGLAIERDDALREVPFDLVEEPEPDPNGEGAPIADLVTGVLFTR